MLENPELVASNKKIAVISALWFFKTKVIDKISGGINQNSIVSKVTPYINTASKGLKERKLLFNNAAQFIDCL